MTGTILNVITVLVGALLGTVLGARLPEKMRETMVAGIALVVLLVGLSMALRGDVLIVLVSVLLGTIVGELLHIDDGLNALGHALEERFARGAEVGTFAKGFVTASLVFCVGPLTILGSIQDGLLGDYRLLAIKSVLDGFTALAFASALGIGVAFSALTVFTVQGAIALLAMLLGSVATNVTRESPWVVQLSATGGVLVLGIALLLLDVRRIRVANMLPSLVFAPLIVALLDYFKLALP